MFRFAWIVAAVFACALVSPLYGGEAWTLTPAELAASGETAADRGDIASALRVLKSLETDAAAPGLPLAERRTLEALVDRLRLAAARAHTAAGEWEKSLPLLAAIRIETRPAAIQKSIVAAQLAAMRPILLAPDGPIVAPWTPPANDRSGPHQPDAALRAPYTRIDRAALAPAIREALDAWRRLSAEGDAELREPERATAKLFGPLTCETIRFAWGFSRAEDVDAALRTASAAERAAASLRFARLLIAERDLARAVPLLIELSRGEDPAAKHGALVEILRVHCAWMRLRGSLPMLNPGIEEIAEPLLKNPEWTEARRAIEKEFDLALGRVDLRVVVAEAPKPIEEKEVTISEQGEIVVPTDVLAKAELGDHFETMNLDRPSEPKRIEDVAGMLRFGMLAKADPEKSAERVLGRSFELQTEHKEFVIECTGPDGKIQSDGSRPHAPGESLEIGILTRYHGEIVIEARRLPSLDNYNGLRYGVSPTLVSTLPVIQTWQRTVGTLADNLKSPLTKTTIRIEKPDLPPGVFVIVARARYSPVVAVSRLAVSSAKLIARYGPSEILVCAVDRRTGAPLPNIPMAGNLWPIFNGEQAWGDRPFPGAIGYSVEMKAEFFQGVAAALNDITSTMGSDAYLSGVRQGRELRGTLPLKPIPFPEKADAQGMVRIPLSPTWRGHSALVRATIDGCPVDGLNESINVAPEKRATVVEWIADRPVVRPRETLRLRAFVREGRDGSLRPSTAVAPLRLTLDDKTVLFDGNVAPDATGVCAFELLIDEDLPDGVIAATPGGSTLIPRRSKNDDPDHMRISEDKPVCRIAGGLPATRQMELIAPLTPVLAGSRVRIAARVSSASGLPLLGETVDITVSFRRCRPIATDPLPFGDAAARFQPELATELPEMKIVRGAVTDATGEAFTEIELPASEHTIGTIAASLRGSLRNRSEQSARILSIHGDFVCSVTRATLGANGQPARLEFDARRLNGAPFTEPVEIFGAGEVRTVTPDATGHAHIDLPTGSGPQLAIRPASRVEGAMLTFNLRPEGGVDASPERRGRLLAASLDASVYPSGGTARFTLRADRPGLSVLMTTENQAVTRSRWITLEGRQHEFDLKLEPFDAPNTTLVFSAVADDRLDTVVMPLKIHQSERSLSVRLACAAEANPGQTVPADIVVTDAGGRPVADCEVVLGAYDRRLLSLGNDPAPEFGAPFLAAQASPQLFRALEAFALFTYGSAYLWTVPELAWGPYAVSLIENDGRGSFGARGGGGRRLMVKRHGGSKATSSWQQQGVRRRFETQALWLTRLTTGPDGKVSAPFPIPDGLTTYTLTAYALDKEGRPGTASTDVRVMQSVEVGLEAPTELREGDSVEMRFRVTNHSPKPQTVKLQKRFPLPIRLERMIENGAFVAAPESVTLPSHATATFAVMLDASTEAVATLPAVLAATKSWNGSDAGPFARSLPFELIAQDGAGGALDRAIFDVPLRMSGRPVRQLAQSVQRNGGVASVAHPGSLDPNRTAIQLTVRRGLRGLALDTRELQYVFPEHCLEQTASRMVPAVVLAEALGEQAQSPADRERLHGVLHSGIARLAANVHSSTHEVQPVVAWYLRRLAETSSGRSIAETRRIAAEWANKCYIGVHATPAEGEQKSASPARFDNAYGGFRQDLWRAFGRVQDPDVLVPSTERRENISQFQRSLALWLEDARRGTWTRRDCALLALICATLELREPARELLAIQKRAAPDEAFAALETALMLETQVELKSPPETILQSALALEQQISANKPAFGTTFLNGICLMAIADALRLSGAASNPQEGLVVIKLGDRTVAQLPKGSDVRRVSVPQDALTAAFKEGWQFFVIAPEGQAVGLTVDVRTLVADATAQKTDLELEALRYAFDPATMARDDSGLPVIRRLLFVRSPAMGGVAFPWIPYGGQAVPRGTELLALTRFETQSPLPLAQLELPEMPGWESAMAHEQAFVFTPPLPAADVISQHPGSVDVALALKGGRFTRASIASHVIESLKKGAWTRSTSSLPLWSKVFEVIGATWKLTPQVRAGRRVLGPVPELRDVVLAQWGPLTSVGEMRLPGARVWGWYNSEIDVTGLADRVSVRDDADPSLKPAAAPLEKPGWLDRALELLARRDDPIEEALGESIDAIDWARLQLCAIGGAEAEALLMEELQTVPKSADLEAFRKWWYRRAEFVKDWSRRQKPSETLQSAIARMLTLEGLYQDLAAAKLAAPGPLNHPVPELLDLLASVRATGGELLPWLRPADRARWKNGASHTLVALAAVGFSGTPDPRRAAEDWLWQSSAMSILEVTQQRGIDGLCKEMRERFGLRVEISPRAPLVLGRVLPEGKITLREYFESHLTRFGMVAEMTDGVLRIKDLQRPDAGPLTAKEALGLPVFGGPDEGTSAELKAALWLRGIQWAVPSSAIPSLKEMNGAPLHAVLESMAKPEQTIRASDDIIELR